jgi:NDP-sugar pyrophosphorylase family protein
VQIVIPMSGFGERFRRSGYTTPKPLIEIEGKPIIAHVIDMFPGELDFLFICNQDHLSDPVYRMEETIRRYCPTGRIVGIQPHKLGPVYAVRQVEHLLDVNQPVVVNYCDFTCYWDWQHFKRFARESACVGAIPAYKGFHPHTLGGTNYAYLREQDGWVQDIQEKQPYTDNRMEEYASSGTYYFASVKILIDAFRFVMEAGLSVGGEYYVSLAYKPLLASGQPVAIYPLQHFMQWGTPEDVTEYKTWSDTFRSLVDRPMADAKPQGSWIVPMAGLGLRFAAQGYQLTKPLIPVSGIPMVVQAARDLPIAKQQVFVIRSDMNGYNDVLSELQRSYPHAVIKEVDHVTEGQACSALNGLDALESQVGHVPEPITVGACDNGALYNYSEFIELIDRSDADVIIWCIRGYPNASRHPTYYGWIDAEDGLVQSISVKKPLGNPSNDPVVIGTFTFRRTEDFRRSVAHMIARDGRVNGEFYIDSCINDAIELGLRCRLFEVDSYLCWGTPDDLRTFEYWQSCFHKWRNHPYRMEMDHRIPQAALSSLERAYAANVPVPPKPRI